MNKNFAHKASLLISVAACLNAVTTYGAPVTTPKPLDVKAFADSREKAVRTVLDYLQVEIGKPNRGLVEDVRIQAAFDLLGNYRAEKAVEFLANNVTLAVNNVQFDYVPLGLYPSARALIQIGNPSVQEILRRMKPLGEGAEYDQRDLHLFAYVIRQVDGDEVGLFRLQQAAKSAQGTHKLNLLNLIDIYKRNESEFDIRKLLAQDDGSNTITIPANPPDKRY